MVSRVLLGAAALVPPVVLVVVVARYAQNVPYQDAWVFARLIVRDAVGTLSLADLWERHIDHRVFLPELLMLTLARATAWDVRYEIACGLGVMVASFALLVSLLRRTVGSVAPGASAWLVLATSALWFSMAQWENWLWGWQLTVFGNIFFTVLAAWALERFRGRGAAAFVMTAAAAAAAVSFASGLLLLALVPAALLVSPRDGRWFPRLRSVLLTAVVCAGVARLSFVGFGFHPNRPVTSPFAAPRAAAGFVLTYLGAPLAAGQAGWAALWGAVGLLLGSVCAILLWRRSETDRRIVLPWLLLGTYAVGSGGAITFGRLGGSIGSALSARYVTFSSLFWVCVVVLATLALEPLRDRGPATRLLARGCLLTMLALGTVGYAATYRDGLRSAAALHARIAAGGECLRQLDDASDRCLWRLCWDPALVRARAPALRRLRLGPFAGSDAAPGRDSLLE